MCDPLEIAKVVIAAIALLGTYFAYKTYLRNEKWKRAEFLAKEMKEFFSASRIQNALRLIDWGTRRIHLLEPASDQPGTVVVTRALQVRALTPHVLLEKGPDVESDLDSPTPNILRRFTPAEAAIRDCYDELLDGLERFSHYVRSDLVSARELNPYLEYWIEEIHATPKLIPEDSAWAASLLTYIQFYRFYGVQDLFAAFGKDITCNAQAYHSFLKHMEDQDLARRLAGAVGIEYLGRPTEAL